MAMPPITLGLGFTSQGVAGGGNVFNGAPLFGDNTGTGGSSTGADGASATAATSPLGNASVSAGTSAQASSTGISAYLPYIIYAGIGLVFVFVIKKLFFAQRK